MHAFIVVRMFSSTYAKISDFRQLQYVLFSFSTRANILWCRFCLLFSCLLQICTSFKKNRVESAPFTVHSLFHFTRERITQWKIICLLLLLASTFLFSVCLFRFLPLLCQTRTLIFTSFYFFAHAYWMISFQFVYMHALFIFIAYNIHLTHFTF